MAPISLVLLNPLGFLCMEVGERLRESRRLAQKIIPIQQADASTGSDNQLSRKVSTSSSGSLSSSNHSRSHANRCKVYQPKIKKTKNNSDIYKLITLFQKFQCRQIFLTVWKNMLFTPIVAMTVMGIAVNFLCDHQIPAILKNLCGVIKRYLANATYHSDSNPVDYK